MFVKKQQVAELKSQVNKKLRAPAELCSYQKSAVYTKLTLSQT